MGICYGMQQPDAVRKHSHQITPEGNVDYIELWIPTMRDILSGFRKRMDKRLGYPRITIKCRYGFKLTDSAVDIMGWNIQTHWISMWV